MIVTFSFSFLLHSTRQIKFSTVGIVSLLLSRRHFFRVSAMRQKGLLFLFYAYPKNPHLDQKKSKKNRPTDGTGTVRRQVKKKHKKGHDILKSE